MKDVKMSSLKSQSSFEFIVFFILLLSISLSVAILNVNLQAVIATKKSQLNAQRILDTLENEIAIAIKMGNGYERTFVFLPSTESMKDYNVSCLGKGIMKVEWGNGNLYKKMPTNSITNGTSDKFDIAFGTNKISNHEGTIIIEGV
jgi:hypothetical protein